MRRRLVPVWEDESSPHSPAGRRGVASFPRGKTRRRLIPAWGDVWYRPMVGGPRTSILLDRYIPPVPASIDQNQGSSYRSVPAYRDLAGMVLYVGTARYAWAYRAGGPRTGKPSDRYIPGSTGRYGKP
ncbi:hypothetical protein GW17_00047471 [Ensete ventricosum]|nr:hypothetical protein GW17_00047471 [Ensete ventricosum]